MANSFVYVYEYELVILAYLCYHFWFEVKEKIRNCFKLHTFYQSASCTTKIIYILPSSEKCILLCAEKFSPVLYNTHFLNIPFRESFLFKFVAYFFPCIIYQEQKVSHKFFNTIFRRNMAFSWLDGWVCVCLCMFYKLLKLYFHFKIKICSFISLFSFSKLYKISCHYIPCTHQLITSTKHRFIIQKNVRNSLFTIADRYQCNPLH